MAVSQKCIVIRETFVQYGTKDTKRHHSISEIFRLAENSPKLMVSLVTSPTLSSPGLSHPNIAKYAYSSLFSNFFTGVI